MNTKILLLLSLVSAPWLRSMDGNHRTVYAIPGQNRLGGEPEYVTRLLWLNREDSVVKVGTPSLLPDLGQRNCLKYLQDAVRINKEDGIIHATSQGTATALNYVAHHDNERKIKALILEAVMLSGNNAIHHTIGGPLMNMSAITRLPASYYWLPYLAKLQFPAYWPGGTQPIKSLSNIPSDMPIVIAHFTKDPQLSYNDACALYYGLKITGKDKVYFITKNGSGHTHVLDEYADSNTINTILAKHGLGANESVYTPALTTLDLSKYQPDHMPYKKLYDDLIFKETIHQTIKYPAGVIGVGAVAAALWALKPK